MKVKESTILYCARCRMSTPHAVAGHTYTCRRCGTDKVAGGKHRHHRETGRLPLDAGAMFN
jgi:anaerobic ribonucleoside-triphosphate reductase